MQIGIIGAGNLGRALAKRLIASGHDVMLSYTRDSDTLGEAAKKIGARAGTPAEAAHFGDVVALAQCLGTQSKTRSRRQGRSMAASCGTAPTRCWPT